MKKYIYQIIFILFLSSHAYAGGWVPAKGRGFFELKEYSILGAKNFFGEDGTIEPITTTSIYISSLYAEYGLGKKWSAIAYVPFFFRQTINEVVYIPGGVIEDTPGDEGNFFGDVDLSIKYGLIQDRPTVLSLRLTLGLPLGTVNGGRFSLINSGDGEFNQLLMLEAGRAMGNFFVQAKFGFNHRTNGFSEEIRYGAEVGYKLGKFLLIGSLNGVQSLKNESENTSMGGLFSNNISFVSVSPKLLFNMNKKWGLEANVQTVLYAERILAAPAWNFGIYFKP